MSNVSAAKKLVIRFLRLMEERDLETAESLMAPNPRIIFPGGRLYRSQREMVTAVSGRYQWVKKQFDQIDSFVDGEQVVVYVLGTLYGVNRYGAPFSGVRFVDRFEVHNNQITRQDVWNDLAESSLLERKSS